MCAELLLKIYQLGYAKVEEYREENGVKCGIHPLRRAAAAAGGIFYFLYEKSFQTGRK